MADTEHRQTKFFVERVVNLLRRDDCGNVADIERQQKRAVREVFPKN